MAYTPIPAERDGLFTRTGKRLANIPSNLFNDLLRGTHALQPEGEPLVQVPDVYDVDAPQGVGEAIVDAGAQMAEMFPAMMVGRGIGGGFARAARLPSMLSKIVTTGAEFGAGGATVSNEQAATDTALGMGFGLAEKLPMRLRVPVAGAIGVSSGLLASKHGASPAMATGVGVANSAMAALLGPRAPRLPNKQMVDNAVAAESISAAPPTSLMAIPETKTFSLSGEVPRNYRKPKSDLPTYQLADEAQTEMNFNSAPSSVGESRLINQRELRFNGLMEMPEGSLVRDARYTEAEARRAGDVIRSRVRAPEGSLIREPRFSADEALTAADVARRPPPGSLIRQPLLSEGEAMISSRTRSTLSPEEMAIRAASRKKPLDLMEPPAPAPAAVAEPVATLQPKSKVVAKEYTEIDAEGHHHWIDLKRGFKVAGDDTTSIHGVGATAAEAKRNAKAKLSQVIEGEPIDTLQPVAPKAPRITYKTVVDESNIAEVAKKLNLTHQGFVKFKDKHLFELRIEGEGAAAGGNINPKVGATYAEIKDYVQFKHKQFAAKTPEARLKVEQAYEARRLKRESGMRAAETKQAAKAEPKSALNSKKKINPLARRDQDGYVPTADVMREAVEIVGPDEFQRLADERITNIGAASEGMQAIAVERTARKIVAARMLREGHVFDMPDNILLKEIHEEAKGVATLQQVDEGLARQVQKTANAEEVGGINTNEVGIGTLDDVAKKVENKAVGNMKMKLGGGGTMKKSNFGEAGHVAGDALLAVSRYFVPGFLGGTITYAADDDHELSSAILGAIAGGMVGHFGPQVFKAFVREHPSIATKGSLAGKIAEAGKAAAKETYDLSKATLTVDESMAAKAGVRFGTATRAEKLARYLEQKVGVYPLAARLVGKAHGEVEILSSAIDDAIVTLSRHELIENPIVKQTLNDYFSGAIDFAALKTKITDTQIQNMAALARHSANTLQKMLTRGIGNTPLGIKIKKSIGNYLTRSYKIFTDPSYNPTEAQIATAATAMSKKWGDMDERLKLIHEVIKQAKAEHALFNDGFGSRNPIMQGEALSTVLTRIKDLPPEFRAMLGEYTDPLERMAATGIKLVQGARTAQFFNHVATGRKASGLRIAYTPAVYRAEKARLQALIARGDQTAVATLQELTDYVPNSTSPTMGRLAGQHIDRRIRDQLATFESIQSIYSTPYGRVLARTANAIKYGHTVLSPLQFVRQIVSVPILGMLSRTHPGDHAKALMTLMRDPAERKRMIELGIAGGDMVGGMLRQDMQPILAKQAGRRFDLTRLGRAKKGWEEIWRTPDLVIRVATFQKKEAEFIASGMSKRAAENAAIDFTNRYTMNYAALPALVIKGRQIPFVNQYLSFGYEMMRITRNLLEDAAKGDVYAIGTLGVMATTPFLIQKLSEEKLSPNDKEDWEMVKALAPDYSRQNFKFVQRRLPNGDFQYIDYTPIVPFDFLRTLRALGKGDMDAAEASNSFFGWENTPLLNVATTLVSGRERHSGMKLNDFKDYANSIRRDIAPPIFGGTELDRWERALRMNDEGTRGVTNIRTGQTDTVGSIVQTYLTAMRPYSVRPIYLVRQAENEARERLQTSATERNRILYSNSSPENKQRAIENYNRVKFEVLAALQQKLNPAAEVRMERQ